MPGAVDDDNGGLDSSHTSNCKLRRKSIEETLTLESD